MATLADVKAWYTVFGVSHIVSSARSHFTWTLCPAMWSGDPDEEPPVKLRVCRKCRANLKKATVKSNETHENA